MDRAWDAMAHVHARMSFHEQTSDLAAIRVAQPGETIDVACETVSVLRIALALFEATDGLFDVATGRQLVRSGFLPRAGVDHLGRFAGNSADIEILDDRRVSVKRRVLVDLGGIAKGFAVDQAVQALQAHDVPVGLVNAGGDLRGFGCRDWPVGLRDADDVVRSGVAISEGALASSANLHNRRRHRGVAHAPHIGRNGQPVLTAERITVIADTCVIADAMTKVAMVDMDLADKILATYGGHVLRLGPQREVL